METLAMHAFYLTQLPQVIFCATCGVKLHHDSSTVSNWSPNYTSLLHETTVKYSSLPPQRQPPLYKSKIVFSTGFRKKNQSNNHSLISLEFATDLTSTARTCVLQTGEVIFLQVTSQRNSANYFKKSLSVIQLRCVFVVDIMTHARVKMMQILVISSKQDTKT